MEIIDLYFENGKKYNDYDLGTDSDYDEYIDNLIYEDYDDIPTTKNDINNSNNKLLINDKNTEETKQKNIQNYIYSIIGISFLILLFLI